MYGAILGDIEKRADNKLVLRNCRVLEFNYIFNLSCLECNIGYMVLCMLRIPNDYFLCRFSEDALHFCMPNR